MTLAPILFEPVLKFGGKLGDQFYLSVLLIFPALVIIAGVHDLVTMKIPNWISIVLIAVFFPVALMVGLPWQDVLMSTGLAFGVLVAGFILFALRVIGGGDAKILAAASLWVGLSGLLYFLLYVALAGGVLSVALLVSRKWYSYLPVAGVPQWLSRLMEPKGDIPYGVAIATAAALVFPSTVLVSRVLAL